MKKQQSWVLSLPRVAYRTWEGTTKPPGQTGEDKTKGGGVSATSATSRLKRREGLGGGRDRGAEKTEGKGRACV